MGSRVVLAFVLLGAFLMFTVEPLCGRLLLPHYGGSFHVWATCMAVFQGTLFLGYLYCHLLAPWLGRLHLVVLVSPLVALPLALRGAADLRAPIVSVAQTLAATVGLPFLALATTAVVAQSWLVRSTLPEREQPYRLYAASNLGSLLGLLAYPLLIEPTMSLSAQRAVWSAGYVVYVLLGCAVAWVCRPAPGGADAPGPTAPGSVDAGLAVTWARGAYWLLLSGAASAFLLAVTNVLTLDIGSVPLLWTFPLAVYLSTFILAFREPPWYPRALQRTWVQVAMCGVALALSGNLGRGGHLMALAVAAHLSVLFVVCLAAHSELNRTRPGARGLTAFYLLLSLGGWLGGLFVSLAAPVLFSSLAEYPMAIAAVALTIGVARRREAVDWLRSERRALVVSSGALSVLAVGLIASSAPPPRVFVHRNFYGIYAVEDVEGPQGTMRLLIHGNTIHGVEALDGPSRPLAYYGRSSPLADVLARAPARRATAILGLGAGVMLPHFAAGEQVTIYEIDPDNEAIARQWFRYLERCEADARVVVGDARLALDRGAAPRSLDLVIADAFSSDSVPVHLLTREALEVYASKLRPSGAIVFHISNRFLDLRPSLRATVALVPGLRGAWKDQPRLGDLEEGELEFPSTWFIATRDAALFDALCAAGWTPGGDDLPSVEPWTDDHANSLAPVWHKLQTGSR